MSGPKSITSENAQLTLETRPDEIHIILSGWLDSQTVPVLWPKIFELSRKLNTQQLIIDTSEIQFCDGAGIALLFALESLGRQKKMRTEIHGLSADIQSLMQRFDRDKLAETLAASPKKIPAVEEIGKTAVHLLEDIREQTTFLGHWISSMLWTVHHPKRIRWGDFLRQTTAGALCWC